jgi:tripartite-type tricarboxylate transporter receptor subunit TctC
MARVVARKLQDSWGRPVIVENRPGAGTVVGTDAVARAAPDGYTLLVVGFPYAVNPYLYKKLPYAAADFQPVILAAQTPSYLVVNSASPVRSAKELVALAKSRPGQLNYASTGPGTSNHLAMEYFKNVAGVDLTQIAYKGSAQMVTDLLGGQVDAMFDTSPSVMPHVKAGKLRALAVAGARRSALTPEVPTMQELGWPGFEVSAWYAFVVPARTPPEIVSKLNLQIDKILAMDDVKKIFADQGVEPVGGSIAQFAAFLKLQSSQWSQVIRQAGVTLD